MSNKINKQNLSCQNITFKTCFKIQECFRVPGNSIPIYSPFEKVGNWDRYFQLAIVGEIGSLLNLYCKQLRKYKQYQQQILN